MKLTREPVCSSGVGGGWEKIVQETDAALAAIDPAYTLDQYKEKFGGLRFYFTPSGWHEGEAFARMEEVVWAAEAIAEKTCEACGKPGKMRSEQYWLVTQCDKCYWETRKRMTASKEEYEDE